MSVQQLRDHITSVLECYFPEVPVYVEGEKSKTAYFQPGLISATLDRQREGRYLAVYRFGIRYEQGSLLEAERMADKLSEAMAGMEQGGGAFRVMSTKASNRNEFGKEQIVNSHLFTPNEKDILNVILQGDKKYTIEEAKQSMGLFKNKEVMN